MQNYKEIRQLTITCSLEKTTHVPGDARTDVRFHKETLGGESVRAYLPFPLLLLNMPKHRDKPTRPPF